MAKMKCKCAGHVAAALLALHLLVASMALSPSLHHLLHQDFDAPDHQCAAVVMSAGLVDQPDLPDSCAIRPVLCALPVASLPCVDPIVGSTRELPGERGPPLA